MLAVDYVTLPTFFEPIDYNAERNKGYRRTNERKKAAINNEAYRQTQE